MPLVNGQSSGSTSAAAGGQPAAIRDRVAAVLAVTAVCLGLYLYLGRLSSSPLQTGNESMYAVPPIYMLQSRDFLVPRFEGGIFLDKPPLAHWSIAASYGLFGITVASERLPGAVASLATVLAVYLWVRRRSGERAAVLTGLILLFTYSFWTFMRYSSGDVLLTLFVTLAAFALDATSRNSEGSDWRYAVPAGIALGLAFLSKGLIGLVLPVGAVATGLLLDRTRPIRAWRRGLAAAVVVLAVTAPWHWAMTRRLGADFWKQFYWEQQFLRGATSRFMPSARGIVYYIPVLALAAFPWSLFLIRSLGRRRPSSLPLGWFLFGIVFWSLLVMKREVYMMPLFPAIAILVAERLESEAARERPSGRLAWFLGAVVVILALGVVVWGFRFLSDTLGRGAVILVAPSLAILAVVLLAGGLTLERVRIPIATALACGLVFFALEKVDEGINRFDPIPEFGERVRRECPSGCDAFFVSLNAAHQEFYSRSPWIPLGRPRELIGRTHHKEAYLLMRTADEPLLSEVPMPSVVLERRPWLAGSWMKAARTPGKSPFESLSLVRLDLP